MYRLHSRFVIGKDSAMKRAIYVGLFAILLAPATAGAQAPKSLAREFGMTPRELVPGDREDRGN
jgi:hypothetical protein